MATPPSSSGKRLLQLFLALFAAASICGFVGLRWLVTRDMHSHAPLSGTTPPPELPGTRAPTSAWRSSPPPPR